MSKVIDQYHISVASVVSEYTNEDRAGAPEDSNDYLNAK